MNEQVWGQWGGGGAASQAGGTERRSVCLAKKRSEGGKERWVAQTRWGLVSCVEDLGSFPRAVGVMKGLPAGAT